MIVEKENVGYCEQTSHSTNNQAMSRKPGQDTCTPKGKARLSSKKPLRETYSRRMPKAESTPTERKIKSETYPLHTPRSAMVLTVNNNTQGASPYSQKILRSRRIPFTEGAALRRSKSRLTSRNMEKFGEKREVLESIYGKKYNSNNTPIMKVTKATLQRGDPMRSETRTKTKSLENSVERLNESQLHTPKQTRQMEVLPTSAESIEFQQEVIEHYTPYAVDAATRELIMDLDDQDSSDASDQDDDEASLRPSPKAKLFASPRNHDRDTVVNDLLQNFGDANAKLRRMKNKIDDTVVQSPLSSPTEVTSPRNRTGGGDSSVSTPSQEGRKVSCASCVRAKQEIRKLEISTETQDRKLKQLIKQSEAKEEQYKLQMIDLQSTIDEMNETVRGTNEELLMLKEKHSQELSENNADVEKQLKALEQSLEAANAELDEMKESYSQLSEGLKETEKMKRELETEADSLRTTLVSTELDSSNKDRIIEDLKEQENAFKSQLGDFEKEKDELQNECHRLEALIKRNEEKREKRLTLTEETIKMNEQLTEELADVRQRERRLSERCEQLTAEFDQERQQLLSRLDQLRTEREEHDNDVWEARELEIREQLEIEHLQEVNRLRERENTLQEEKAVAEERAQTAEVALVQAQHGLKVERRKSGMVRPLPADDNQESEGVSERVRTLEEQLQSTLARVNEFRNKARESQAKADSLQEVNRELTSRIESFESIRAISMGELNTMEAERDSARVAHKKLCLEHHELVKKHNELLTQLEVERKLLSETKKELALVLSGQPAGKLQVSAEGKLVPRTRPRWWNLLWVVLGFSSLLFALVVQLSSMHHPRTAFPT